MEVDRAEVLDPGRGQGGHHVRRAVGGGAGPAGQVLGLVGAPLAEDPALVDREEPDQRAGQGRVGVDGPAGRGQRVVGSR